MVLLFRGLGLARFNHAALHCAVNASISTVALQQAQPIWPCFDGAGSQIVILQKRCEELFVSTFLLRSLADDRPPHTERYEIFSFQTRPHHLPASR